jgi:hypothetical protein
MTLALYATIWAALVLLAAGEAALALGRPRHFARGLHLAGAALNLLHAVIAMGLVHGWSHAAAVRATAAQTRRVFGLDWGGGIWANYLFVAIWFMYAWGLRTAADQRGQSPWAWVFRGFVLLMVANGAIVFAAGPRRALGMVIVATLVWSWWRQARRSRSAWKNALV